MDVQTLESLLWPKGDKRDIWMVLDGARNRSIYTFLVNSYLTSECLYAGDLDPMLEAAAPHLVQLEREDKYTRQLLERAWGKSWGIILKCDTSIHRLRRHLRRFLTVSDPRGRKLMFRYYDPRVLRIYLPTCMPDELRTVFGPVECFWTESGEGDSLVQFQFDGRQLRTRTDNGAV